MLDKYFPAPAWFWEMFNKIFEGDFGWWGAFMKVAVVAPIVEELIFRGLILQGFRRNYTAFTAVFMSALLFALFHLNPWQFPATFVWVCFWLDNASNQQYFTRNSGAFNK
ncbi:MAG: CPBP family intramembrane metalloprotease [Draconibacterium sp.]|nr:CPBP family intramembrane metalloprotease [Draconibacterium sp.]